MIIEKEFLGLSDIAKICKTSKNNVSNWRQHDDRFPKPYIKASTVPIWKAEDISAYLKQRYHNIEYDLIPAGNILSKRIAIVGRARGGKSFFISRFVKDKKGFEKLFCGNSSDKTVCQVYVHVSERTQLEIFIFHSDFNSIYKDEDGDDIATLRSKVNSLINNSYEQDDLEKMSEIESIIQEIKEVEKKYPGRKNSYTYIETFQKPNDFCKEILRECGIRSIEILDTPGISGNIEASKIAKSDIYLFLVKPDNKEESETLKKIVTEIKADIATSKVAFLYKREGYLTTHKRYNEAREEARKDMLTYNELFSDFKGNIINTELDVLNPAGHCILFPTMDEYDLTLAEELFLQDIKVKLLQAFKKEDETDKDNEFETVLDKYGDDAKKLVLEIMENIKPHSCIGDNNFATVDFILEKHNRVMTKDNYRIRNDLCSAYSDEINLLDSYFSSFKDIDYPEEWQQIVIKYVYRKLVNSVKKDRGLGVGIHPFEENPARTMLVEESIFADKILDNILDKDEYSRNEPYRKALRDDSGISSTTWNYVGCIDDYEAILKLKIIKECLLNVPVSSRKEMVLCRYIGGLRKVSQYKILEKMGLNESDCIKKVAELPFFEHNIL